MIFLTKTLKTQLGKLKNTNQSLNYALGKKNNGIMKKRLFIDRNHICKRTVHSTVYISLPAVLTNDTILSGYNIV